MSNGLRFLWFFLGFHSLDFDGFVEHFHGFLCFKGFWKMSVDFMGFYGFVRFEGQFGKCVF